MASSHIGVDERAALRVELAVPQCPARYRTLDHSTHRTPRTTSRLESRQRLAQAYIEDKVVTLTNQRAADRRRAGQPAGPEGSIGKLLLASTPSGCRTLPSILEGSTAQAWPEDDRWLKGTAWSLLRVRSKTIAGGTSEVQRNILGERILGLPKEAEVDRDVPWSQVLRS